jgi:hypothetical protein
LQNEPSKYFHVPIKSSRCLLDASHAAGEFHLLWPQTQSGARDQSMLCVALHAKLVHFTLDVKYPYLYMCEIALLWRGESVSVQRRRPRKLLSSFGIMLRPDALD